MSRQASCGAAVFAAMLLLSGCVSGVPVSVSNRSAVTLTNVTVSGSGFSESLGNIPAGGGEVTHIRPRDESQFKVAFEVAGERYSAVAGETIQNDRTPVQVTVNADFTITIDMGAGARPRESDE